MAEFDMAYVAEEVATTFHPYTRLPPEIKLKIWDYVFSVWASGAHHFRLRVDPRNPSKLIVEPEKHQKEDASAWRERRVLSHIDKYSFDYWHRLENNATLLFRNLANNHVIKVDENNLRAVVDGKHDLVTFRFNYGATHGSLAMLDLNTNRETFAGITKIGLDFDLIRYGYLGKQRYYPFFCPCPPPAAHAAVCGAGIVEFLRFFKDLRACYIIYPLLLRNINARAARKYCVPGSTLWLQGKSVPRPGSTCRVGLDVFLRTQEHAQQNGSYLEFHDRIGTYQEVDRSLLADDLVEDDLWFHLNNLDREWRRYHTANQVEPGSWGNVHFRAVFRVDLRGVTTPGNPTPLRFPQQYWR